MELEKELGARLKLLRTRRGLKQEEVAEAVGLSVSQYSNIETGYTKSTKLQTAIKLAQFFEVSLDFLLALKNNETMPDGTLLIQFKSKPD